MTISRLSIFLFPILGLFLSDQSNALAKPAVYHNPQFGIALAIPAGVPTCSGANDQTDHGIAIFLDGRRASNCGNLEHRRTIAVFASYNVIDETETLDGNLNWTCKNILNSSCVPAPRGLGISTLNSVSGQANLSDGRVEIVVLAQGGRFASHQNDDGNGAINYEVTLYTDRIHFREDLRSFRIFLNILRITPPS